MAQAKIHFALGVIEFSGEGEEAWVATELDKLIEQAPTLLKLASPTAGQGIATGPTTSSASATGGFKSDLTRIVALSWPHGGNTTLDITLDGEPKKGLIVAFGKGTLGDGGLVRVESGSLDDETFQIFVELFDTESGADFWTSRRIQPTTIVPITPIIGLNGLVDGANSIVGPEAEGAALLLSDATFVYLQKKKLSVLIKGEFVLDETGQRAIDAEFIRAKLPTSDPPRGADLGTQRGRFESWAWVGRIVNINTGTIAELRGLPRIGPELAQRIVMERPFSQIEELLRVAGIGPATLVQIRSFVMV